MGRPWTSDEDRQIRNAAQFTRNYGIEVRFQPGRRHAALRDVAEQLGRTYAAVRKRASRLGVRSYLSDQQERAERAARLSRLRADSARAAAAYRAELEAERRRVRNLDPEALVTAIAMLQRCR